MFAAGQNWPPGEKVYRAIIDIEMLLRVLLYRLYSLISM